MDEATAEEFKGFADLPSNKTHRNVPRTLLHRDTGLRQRHNGVPIEFQWAAEDKLVLKDYEEMKCHLPGVPTRSTFLMVFSPDGKRVASTHGNHNIYVTDLTSGKNINTLSGHPRTPWCIAFHPSSNQILASGCLGGQVRVWDLHGGSEIWITKSQTVIASIAFHPTERMLVIATYNELYFWDWSQPEPYATCHTSNDKEKVRYVTFDPLGYKLITGISNAPAVVSQWDRVGPTMTSSPRQPQEPSTSAGLSHEQDQRRITICYRSLVEQYEQLVQRYYDLTRSRATTTMDRGTDPMDLDPAALNENCMRLRQPGCTTPIRCNCGTCSSSAQPTRDSQAGSSQSGLSQPGLSQPGLSQPGLSQPGLSQPDLSQPSFSRFSSSHFTRGIGSTVSTEQHVRVRRWMNTNRFCQTSTLSTSTDGISSGLGTPSSSGASSSTATESSSGIGRGMSASTASSSAVGASSSAIGASSSNVEASSSAEGTSASAVGASSSGEGTSSSVGANSTANDPHRSFVSILASLRSGRPVIGVGSLPSGGILPPFGRRDSPDTPSYMEQNRNRRALTRDTSINHRNLLRLFREHQRDLPTFRSPEASAGASQSGVSTGRSGASTATSDTSRGTPSPRTGQSTAEETRGERRSLSHIRTYDVSRTGPVLPSFSSDAELSPSPERPRRFFFSQRSAFQPQAPRSPAVELEERARRLSSLTRGLYQRRATGRAPPPPPPPPPVHETADIGVRYGIQLLSRHIDNMQRLCRARLEILQLQQIRRMWEDLQLQIRSLHVASRGACPDPPPPLPPRRHAPPSEPLPKTSNYSPREPGTATEGRTRRDLYRYLNCRSQRATRRNAEQRRSVAWRHYSGRRPGQEVPSFRHRSGARTTTESSTQASARPDDEGGCEGDSEESRSEPNVAGPSGCAAVDPLATDSNPTQGVKRSHSELEAETPATVTHPAATPSTSAASESEASGSTESQPTTGQGRTTSQSLRSMIARLESLVRDQRELAASFSSGAQRQEAPRPTTMGATLSAEERLASALQNEEYESGRLYRSTLGRRSRLEDWEYTRELTRLRARQVLSLMVESLTQFFEENGLSHNTPHAVLDDQIYNLFILLQLALELTDLLLAQLASTRRELEHQWVHRLRSPVALEASETASYREDALLGERPTSRRGRPSAARRPLFHPRGPRDESGSARTAGSLPGPQSSPAGAGSARTDSTITPRPLMSFTSAFGRDFLVPVTGSSSSSISSLLSQAPSPFVQETPLRESPTQSSPPPVSPILMDVRVRNLPSADTARPTGPTRMGLHTESTDRRRYWRVGAAPRAERFRAEAFRVQTPAERRNDEREFMVQVHRYQNATPAVPAVRVNDVLVVDPTAMGQPRARPPSPPNPRALWAAFGPGEGEAEGGPWRPQRFLHPRYRPEPQQDTPYEIAGGGDGFNILRVMGPAFATEHVVLADSPVMPNHRIQAWDFTNLYIPDITDVEKNVVASECKIHNDASVDVSSDGKLLVTLLPSGRFSMTTMLGIYSLEWETLGQCLYTTRFDQNAVSVSLSPVSRHLLVGLASRRVGAIMTDLHTMAQIFRLDKAAGTGTSRGRLCHLRDIEQGREQPFMSINCIRWAPVAGQGLVFGTNNGQLKVLR